MVHLISSNSLAYTVIEKAIYRSHGNFTFENTTEVYFFISPSLDDEQFIKEIVKTKTAKIVLLGKISSSLANFIGLKKTDENIELNPISVSHENKEDISTLFVKYYNHTVNTTNPLKKRYFYRFDFTDEWNNLGYGTIKTDGSIWAISNILQNISATIIADINDTNNHNSVFSSIKDFQNSSILYINRETATVDGLDWSIVENYLSTYRVEQLPVLPLVCDIPASYEAIVSSRLDCDQSVINSKALVELYKKYNINISLAITTGIGLIHEDIEFLNTFYNNGGAILSHTVNHYENWGENYHIAYTEALNSKNWLENNITNLKELNYAVSPFHSNKTYSIQALSDSSYNGFISGIIHNDPEYLVATSGIVPFVNSQIVTHSQHCMLHGDCYHRNNNTIEIYKESFSNHYLSKKIFGYLDHPFGEYDYGWYSEEERLKVHQEFIEYINSFKGVKWLTCTEILDFVVDNSKVNILIGKYDNPIIKRETFNSKEKIKIIYKGKIYLC